jgi:hypothetical protein
MLKFKETKEEIRERSAGMQCKTNLGGMTPHFNRVMVYCAKRPERHKELNRAVEDLGNLTGENPVPTQRARLIVDGAKCHVVRTSSQRW